MTVIGFSHYNLRAPRALLDELREFYCSVVGLVAGARPPFSNFGYWLYLGDGAVLHLSEALPEEGREPNVAATFDHVAFSCTGLQQMREHLLGRGIQFRTAHVPLTGQTQLFIRDPAGNGVELNFDERDA